MGSTAVEFTPRLSGLIEGERTPTVCVSFGMGLDSSALLARWLTDPSSRDFALEDMVVLTAMTGHESAATISAVSRHMLSLFQANSVVRPGRSGGKGITARSLRVTATGSRDQMARKLARQPGRPVRGADGIVRHVLRDRATDSSKVDHLYVAAPAGGLDKQRPGFEQWWQEVTGDALF